MAPPGGGESLHRWPDILIDSTQAGCTANQSQLHELLLLVSAVCLVSAIYYLPIEILELLDLALPMEKIGKL